MGKGKDITKSILLKFCLLVFFLVFSLSFLYTKQVEASPDPSCQINITSLPYTIDQNNTYYCLNESLYIAGQTAISFSSGVQNSTLDCLNYNLDGNDTSDAYGVYLAGSDTKNNTIKNCNVIDFENGIYLFNGPKDNKITNNTIETSVSEAHGIFMNISNNNNISLNIINTTGSDGYGIYGYNSSNNTIYKNTINTYGSSAIGIPFEYSNYNKILSNNITTQQGDGFGIFIESWSEYNNLSFNNITTYGNNADNIYLYRLSNNNNISSNIIYSGSGNGINLRNSSYNTADNNELTIKTSPSSGIWVWDDAKNNTFYNNSLNISGGTYGIESWLAPGNKYYENKINVTSSDSYGAYFSTGSNYTIFVDNEITTSSSSSHAVYSLCSYSNFTNNNITASGSSSYAMYVRDARETNITGAHIFSENSYDYYLRNVEQILFVNTNFTNSRDTYFYDTTSWFNYNNRTDIELWLNTSIDTADNNITRELTNWNQSLMQWNDTSNTSVIAYYNISGLLANTDYDLYNNSEKFDTKTTDADGVLPQFSIVLSGEHEIKVSQTVDGTPPTYSDNSTNSTLAGTPVEHRLKWTDNIGLSGYTFQFCNGTWNGSDCLEGDDGSTTIMLQDNVTENLDECFVDDDDNPTCRASNVLDVSYVASDSGTSSRRTYYRFNISEIPSDATIINASFFAIAKYDIIATPNISLHQVYPNVSWSGDTLVWDNQPCGNNTNNISNASNCNLTSEVNVLATFGTDEYNVLSLVQREYSASSKNISFVLKIINESDTTFHREIYHSKRTESDDDKPYLNITYSLPGEAWTNDTWTSMTGAGNWSNVTKVINSTVGAKIAWCVYANDTSNNWNGTSCETPFSYETTTEEDSTAPLWRNQGTNDTDNTIAQGEAINLTAQGKDETALDWAWLATNETTVWENKSTYGSPMDMDDVANEWKWSNFTWQNSSITTTKTIGWRIYYNDTSGNENVTDIKTFIVDTTGPEFSNPQTYPESPATYSQDQSYQFNITVIDATSSVSKVILEFNNTNYTDISNDSSVYYKTLTDLVANPSGYSYKWYANDTNNIWSNSTTYTYIINKATANATLTIIPATPIIYETQSNATCIEDNPETSGNLYRNDSLANTENNTLIYLPAGIWNYTCNVSQTQNYTSASDSQIYTVNKKNASIQVYPTTQSINYGNSVTQYCTDNSTLLNCSIYRNDSLISNNTEVTLGAGVDVYKANMTDQTNYTNYEDTETLTVNKSSRTADVLFDLSSPIYYGTQLNVSCSDDGSPPNDGTWALYRNETDVTAVEYNKLITYPAGVWNFTCVISGGTNYTDASKEEYFTINQAPAPPSGPGGGIIKTNKVTATSNDSIFRVIVNLTIRVSRPKITITRIITLPVVKAPGVVYGYYEINKTNFENENIDNALIKFKVNKSWVTRNDIDPSKVYLYRYNKTWLRLTIQLTNETTDQYFYQAETPGFSYFGISGFVCTLDEKRCLDNKLQKCNPEGISWIDIETCTYGCNATILKCNPATECPTCAELTEWSKCIEGKQNRTVYYCNASTNYECWSYVETRECIKLNVWLILGIVTGGLTLTLGGFYLTRTLRKPKEFRISELIENPDSFEEGKNVRIKGFLRKFEGALKYSDYYDYIIYDAYGRIHGYSKKDIPNGEYTINGFVGKAKKGIFILIKDVKALSTE